MGWLLLTLSRHLGGGSGPARRSILSACFSDGPGQAARAEGWERWASPPQFLPLPCLLLSGRGEAPQWSALMSSSARTLRGDRWRRSRSLLVGRLKRCAGPKLVTVDHKDPLTTASPWERDHVCRSVLCTVHSNRTEAEMAATATKSSSNSKATKPAYGVKELAEHLHTTPHALRAFIRTLDLGVGRGTRYAWKGVGDPTVKRIVAEWETASSAE